jgi:hypothetical protein
VFSENSVFFLSALVIFFGQSAVSAQKSRWFFSFHAWLFSAHHHANAKNFLQIYKTDFMFHFHLCVQIYNIQEKWYSYILFLFSSSFVIPLLCIYKKVKFSASPLKHKWKWNIKSVLYICRNFFASGNNHAWKKNSTWFLATADWPKKNHMRDRGKKNRAETQYSILYTSSHHQRYIIYNHKKFVIHAAAVCLLHFRHFSSLDYSSPH